MSIYDSMTGKYSLSKTIRFELKPIGKTRDNILSKGFVKEDEIRASLFKKVKGYCDEVHKQFIEEALSSCTLTNLDEYYDLYNSSEKNEKKLEDIKSKLTKEVTNAFENKNLSYIKKDLFEKKMLTDFLPHKFADDSEKLEEIAYFSKFTTYFTNYSNARKNLYASDGKISSVQNRLINENLITFFNNFKIFYKFINLLGDDVLNQFKNDFNVLDLNAAFCPTAYNNYLTQKGIANYNLLIAGMNDGKHSIKGLNSYINEYNQVNPGTKIPKFKELYKQILSDRVSYSFIIDKIRNDLELRDKIAELQNDISLVLDSNDGVIDYLLSADCKDLEGVYISNDARITDFSAKAYGNWGVIANALTEDYKVGVKNTKTKDFGDKVKKHLKSIDKISLAYLNKIEPVGSASSYIKSYLSEKDFKNTIKDYYNQVMALFTEDIEIDDKKIMASDDKIEIVRNYLDQVKELQSFLQHFNVNQEGDVNYVFYSKFHEDYLIILNVIDVYNMVRNYVTQKPYSTEKIKINFNNSTLMSGWDENKIDANLSVILRKDDLYYLGVIDASDKKIFKEGVVDQKGVCYQRVIYRQQSSPEKNLPRIFFSTSWSKDHPIDADLNRIRDNKTYSVGNEKFSLVDLHKFIDYLKDGISEHPNFEVFDFKFKKTSEYNKINEFYNDFSEQAYVVKFDNVSVEYIDELVNQGKLYLFQIYNKDFSPYSKGRPNLHTLYFKELFSEENLDNVVYKLCGGAEMFFRKSSLDLCDTAIHPANEPVKNKNQETAAKKPESVFEYDLIKDKRYTVDKFQLNLPIEMNFSKNNFNFLNQETVEIIRKNDVNIIGIDRGERHLLYISVINSKGEILHQESLNSIINEHDGVKHTVDYHQLLDKVEVDNKKAKKSWKTINNIKELKEGYLSQVVNKIAKLMVDYNAIVVMENLNFGFKNSRKKFEKQVYQKFEVMLINKLNYLIFKDNKPSSPGGVRKAYQLTNKLETLDKIGKQTGFVFYLPAWNTSNIDPVTGYVNLLKIDYTNVEKAKDFINKFDSISYDGELFRFDFDSTNFNDRYVNSKTQWSIFSNSDRIKSFRNPDKNNQWDHEKVDLTKTFIELFNKYSIDYKNGNLISKIAEIDDKKFYTAVSNYDGYDGLFTLLKLVVQMRNSNKNTSEDYIISPVKNDSNEFFDSRTAEPTLPDNADANGAFNIARKGLILVEELKRENDIDKIKITNEEYLNYVQK